MAEAARFDAIVIGSGPGGYVAGIRLGQLGQKTLVVEREHVGGVCINVGCIPSKALIHTAKTFAKMLHAEELGIHVSERPQLDFAATQKWKRAVVAKLTSGIRLLLKANGATLREGEATVLSPHEVEIKRADGTTERVETANLVLALGSRPVSIPGFTVDHQRILDSSDALGLEEIPGRLVVIGGGYIGMELGTVYAKLGAHVTIVEALPSILPGSDPECVQVVARKLKKQGVDIHVNARAKGWAEQDGHAVVTIQVGDQELKLDADRVLVTVGRRPNTDQPWLEKLGVHTDAKGFIPVDAKLRTNVAGVYAIGDCVPGPMLAHKASHEAEVVAEVIAGKPSELDVRTIPAAVFTDPEIASTGLTEDQAKAAGHKVKVGKYPFAALGRALSVNEPDGFAKVIADGDSEELLGVHIVGAGAADLISEAALGIEMGAKLRDVSLTIHPHPTMPEAVMEAAKAALGEAIHVVNRPDRPERGARAARPTEA